jgi:hypothetical protein
MVYRERFKSGSSTLLLAENDYPRSVTIIVLELDLAISLEW